MAREAQAPVAQSNIKWFEATFEVEGKSVRVDYLSDRALNNSQIANMLDRSKSTANDQSLSNALVWINGKNQGTAAKIENAAEMVRSAGEATETGVARHATQAEIDRFAGRRTVEAAGAAARRVGEWAVETGERVVSAIVPVRIGPASEERAAATRGRRRTTVVAETAAGESAEVETAAGAVEIPTQEPAAKEQAPTERRGETVVRTTPRAIQKETGSSTMEFEIRYDSSRPGVGVPAIDRYGYGDVNFFDQPENRPGVVEFRYRDLARGTGWSDWIQPGYKGRGFHREYVKQTNQPERYQLDDAEGVVQKFNIYVYPEVYDDPAKASQLSRRPRRRHDGFLKAPPKGRADCWLFDI